MTNHLSSTKPHFPILDGLRGTAAILVVIFHLCEACFPKLSENPVHHGYLAVDFFFLLSGFVVGYAYDDRWGRMSVWEFFKIRLVRLHPLVILGVLIGAVGFWLDPYTESAQHFNLLKLIGIMLISFTLLPSPDVRGWNETHSLNGPCWSLFQEYIANILYALFVRKASMMVLTILVLIFGILISAISIKYGGVGTGWGFDNIWIGVARMLFPFFAGLLLFRMGKRIKMPMAFALCSLILTVLFLLPTFKYNGIYEALCIVFVFPIVVAAGAGGQIKGRWEKLCNFSGAISYPIYILHYPFIYIYTSWVWNAETKPTTAQIVPVACALFVFFIVLAYVSLKWYDEPIRAWLKTKVLLKSK